MNKKKLFFIIMPVMFFIALIALRDDAKKTNGETTQPTNKSVTVRLQSAFESKKVTSKSEYPAVVSADQEATLSAKTSGTIIAVNFDLGKYVSAGNLLVKIDDSGANLTPGENNLKSAQVQQLELAVEQAKESYDLAKKNEDTDSNASTRAARDIAKIQLNNAKIALQSILDSHNIIAPISGSVVSKNVSVGDSVSAGQTLATISKTGKKKISFFVEQENVASFKIGDKISLSTSDESLGDASITNIAPQADFATKRFQIDAQPLQPLSLPPGVILTAIFQQTTNVTASDNLILPLSALTIAQNEKYIFIAENDLAKKINFEVVRIFGENAEISCDIATDALIIIEGNKLLQDGSKITTHN